MVCTFTKCYITVKYADGQEIEIIGENTDDAMWQMDGLREEHGDIQSYEIKY